MITTRLTRLLDIRHPLIHNVLPAADIVEQIVSEAQAIIRRLPTVLE